MFEVFVGVVALLVSCLVCCSGRSKGVSARVGSGYQYHGMAVAAAVPPLWGCHSSL